MITWLPDALVECEIALPDEVECNSHGIIIESTVNSGSGNLTYDWEVVGDKCFIQGGQGTPEITIYVGWSEVKVILTVTDENGCVSMCMAVLNCDLPIKFAGASPSAVIPQEMSGYSSSRFSQHPTELSGEYMSELNLWPNPTTGSVSVSFESEIAHEVQFTFTNFLGQVVLTEKFNARKGRNTHNMNLVNPRLRDLHHAGKNES